MRYEEESGSRQLGLPHGFYVLHPVARMHGFAVRMVRGEALEQLRGIAAAREEGAQPIRELFNPRGAFTPELGAEQVFLLFAAADFERQRRSSCMVRFQ